MKIGKWLISWHRNGAAEKLASEEKIKWLAAKSIESIE